jgi:hypothetical protein
MLRLVLFSEVGVVANRDMAEIVELRRAVELAQLFTDLLFFDNRKFIVLSVRSVKS